MSRTLPGAPSLEYERKEAKSLLKQVHAGDADALRRILAAHPAAARDRKPHELQLADVQHAIAREYGFASWPKLVEYFEEMERHRNAPRYNSPNEPLELLEERAQGVVRRHQRGDPIVARELAHFVPRFYGRPVPEILATPITEDEARLVLAREDRLGSWEELLERSAATRVWMKEEERTDTPKERLRLAIREHDVDALTAILDAHPELLAPSITARDWRSTPAGLAVGFERRSQNPVAARRVSDLLESRGVDIQRELNERLLGFPQDRDGELEAVQWYLDRGANPDWIPPNGIPVLEHAIVRFRDAASVDLIAARVAPRKALWIAAGLGDVAGVRGFIAGKGELTPEGRLSRPDLMAMGSIWWLPPHQDADDLEIMWEAFRIAGWNGRWNAMDALLESGLPVDHAPLGWPLVIVAFGNLMIPLAEYLVSRGADLDRKWDAGIADGSARGIARYLHEENEPTREMARRLVQICGEQPSS